MRQAYGVTPRGLTTLSTRITSSTPMPPTEWTSVPPSSRSASSDVAGSAATAARAWIVRVSTTKTTVPGDQCGRRQRSDNGPGDEVHPEIGGTHRRSIAAGGGGDVKRDVGSHRADPSERGRDMNGENELAQPGGMITRRPAACGRKPRWAGSSGLRSRGCVRRWQRVPNEPNRHRLILSTNGAE